MSEQYPTNPERDDGYINELMIEYGRTALKELSYVFLSDQQTQELQDNSEIIIRDYDERGSIVPDTQYDSARKSLSLVIEPRVLEEYADDIVDDLGYEASNADVIRILIGAGVARSILGWKMTQMGLNDPDLIEAHKEQICNKVELWDSAAHFDDLHGSNIRRAVERLGDDELMRINWLRFAFGASLRHVSDVPSLQGSLVDLMRKELLQKEHQRAIELEYNLAWLETENAFENYDSKVPFIELAFSFPMSPAEEQRFVNY